MDTPVPCKRRDQGVPGFCLFQIGIYKLSLTNLSHSNCSISIPSHMHPYHPIPPSLIPVHLFQSPKYLFLVPPIHPLAFFPLSRFC